MPFSYWRKRKNLPRKPASVDSASIRQLEQRVSDYFHTMQGRGHNCKVNCYKRGKEGLKRHARRPAFEIIFVYSQDEGTLDIYLSGDREPVPDLQAIFADAILKAGLGPDEKDERVYDLNPMRARQFRFVYGPESGIAEVVVNKLRVKVYGKKERILLEADTSQSKHAVVRPARRLLST